MSHRPPASNEPIGDRVVRLENEVKYLRGLVNKAFRTNGYVLINTGAGLFVRNTATNVDTPIAP